MPRSAAGFARGHLSEIVGRDRRAGRRSLCRDARRGSRRAAKRSRSIDACDRFDPASAARPALDLGELLWVRERATRPRALKAMNLVLQAGGFGLVVFDLADVPRAALRRFRSPPGCASRA